MWKRIAIYGAVLAAGTLALQWFDYRRLAMGHAGGIYIFLIAAAFMALGVYFGARVFARPAALAFDGNPQAVAALKLSPRELSVLKELAAGHSNQDIARRLNIAPDTVKTHLAKLYGKLEAKRRTDAVNRARELGILP